MNHSTETTENSPGKYKTQTLLLSKRIKFQEIFRKNSLI